MFVISQLWLTSHPRSTMVLLNTGTPGTSREIYSKDADDGTRTRNPSVMKREFGTGIYAVIQGRHKHKFHQYSVEGVYVVAMRTEKFHRQK